MSAPLDLPSLKANDKVCQALAKVLADARRGQVSLVAIIAVDDSGKPNVLFGGETDLTPSINFGADILKATIMAQILQAPQQSILCLGQPLGNEIAKDNS